VTDAATTEPKRRAAAAAAGLLAVAVVVGAAYLGAPPRFSSGDSGPRGLRTFLASLWPLTIVEAAAALAFGVLVASVCVRRGSPGLPGGRAASRARLPLVLLLVLGLLQLVPLPDAVLGVVAPFSAKTYASLTSTGDDTMRPISLWPDGTVHALFNLVGVIAASTATWVLVRGERARRNATILLALVASVAVAESAHGLVATKLGGDRLLGAFEKASDNGRVTGTFIHATMLAVWAGMGACAAIGLAAALAFKRRVLVAVAVTIAAGLCVAAAFWSLSRLGLAALLVGALTTWTVVALALRREGRPLAAAATLFVALALVAAGVAAALLVPAFRERVGYLFTPHGLEDLRFPTWKSTWALFEGAPVVGTGLGSFGRAIHLTQSIDCPQELWFAHSDPLNLLSDVGVVGAALAAWWIVATVRGGAPALRSSDVATRCLAAGAFGAAVVVVVASLGDFQTQFPVVAIPFAALATVPAALAAAPAADEAPRAGLVPGKVMAAVATAVALFAAASPIAESTRRYREIRRGEETGATRAEELVAQGRWLLAHAETSQSMTKEMVVEGESYLREAARLDPLLDDAHLWTAFVGFMLDEPQDDVLRALGRARTVSRGHAYTNLVAGKMYLTLLGTSPAPYGPQGDDAVAALREAGALEPKAFSDAWAACEKVHATLDTLRAITPDRGHAKIRLAEHLQSLGRKDDAISVLMDQLGREPWDVDVSTRLAPAMREAGREAEGRAFFARVGAAWPADD
jgi:O-antigen ligase